MFRESLLNRLYRLIGSPPVQLRIKDSAATGPIVDSPIATVTFDSPRTVAGLLIDPAWGFHEGYARGRIQVEGDLAGMLEAAARSEAGANKSWHARLLALWQSCLHDNTMLGSRQNIHRHYDLSEEFFRLWLDHRMLYSCAYFSDPAMTLEDAQLAKMEHICRKLRLRPGESVVDIGSGWGSLALYMAKKYGVRVTGFNVSHEQVDYARRRTWHEGLSHRVAFIEDDYRNVRGSFDAVVSIGMFEHVGKRHYREYGSMLQRVLGASGRGVLNFIGRNRPSRFSPWTLKHIFPGTYAPTLGEATESLESGNFSILDVENQRPHYARTIEHWLDRFEKSSRRIGDMFDPEFVRIWRLYLAGSIAGFRSGVLQLFQITFAGEQYADIPPTREHLYNRGRSGVRLAQLVS